MSAFTCLIEAEKVDTNFLATSNHRGDGNREYATSERSRTHAALALAEVIANQRNLTLVSFNNLGDGSFQARFSDAPEMEGA